MAGPWGQRPGFLVPGATPPPFPYAPPWPGSSGYALVQRADGVATSFANAIFTNPTTAGNTLIAFYWSNLGGLANPKYITDTIGNTWIFCGNSSLAVGNAQPILYCWVCPNPIANPLPLTVTLVTAGSGGQVGGLTVLEYSGLNCSNFYSGSGSVYGAFTAGNNVSFTAAGFANTPYATICFVIDDTIKTGANTVSSSGIAGSAAPQTVPTLFSPGSTGSNFQQILRGNGSGGQGFVYGTFDKTIYPPPNFGAYWLSTVTFVALVGSTGDNYVGLSISIPIGSGVYSPSAISNPIAFRPGLGPKIGPLFIPDAFKGFSASLSLTQISGLTSSATVGYGAAVGTGVLAGFALTNETGQGELDGAGALSGETTTTEVAYGNLMGTLPLAGFTVTNEVSSGALTGTGVLAGLTLTGEIAAGEIDGAGALAGLVTTATTAAGELDGAGALAGSALTVTVSYGALSTLMSGAMSGLTTTATLAYAELDGAGALSSLATTSVVDYGALTGVGTLSGLTTTATTASGELDGLSLTPIAGLSISVSMSYGALTGTLTPSGGHGSVEVYEAIQRRLKAEEREKIRRLWTRLEAAKRAVAQAEAASARRAEQVQAAITAEVEVRAAAQQVILESPRQSAAVKQATARIETAYVARKRAETQAKLAKSAEARKRRRAQELERLADEQAAQAFMELVMIGGLDG